MEALNLKYFEWSQKYTWILIKQYTQFYLNILSENENVKWRNNNKKKTFILSHLSMQCFYIKSLLCNHKQTQRKNLLTCISVFRMCCETQNKSRLKQEKMKWLHFTNRQITSSTAKIFSFSALHKSSYVTFETLIYREISLIL